MFTKSTEQTQYLLTALDLGLVQTSHDFARAYYGDQRLIPHFPAICCESVDKDRDLGPHASSHKWSITLRTHIIIYHEKIQSSQLTKKEDELLAEIVEDYLHTDLTLGNNIIFGYVTRVRPGVAVAPDRVMLRATRLEYEGKSRQTF